MPPRGGTKESKRRGASERIPLSPTRLGETRVKWASVKTNRARREDRGTNPPPPSPPLPLPKEPQGRRPEKRWAPSPEPDGRQSKDWLLGAFCGTFSTSSVLELAYCVLEVDGTFLTSTPAVTSLLFLSGGVLVLVAESMVSFTVVMFGMCLLRDWS